jgi:subtilisin-like proprotein convertase family protein
MMKQVITASLAFVFLCSMAFVASAEKIDNANSIESQPTICPLGLYKGLKQDFVPPITVPDNNPAGITIGPIVFPPEPGTTITDVVIDLEMSHTWVGDLLITVTQVKPDGGTKVATLMNRPGVPATTFGCSGDMVVNPNHDKYYFGLGGGKPLGIPCATVHPHGCYQTAPGLPGLEIFRDQPKDGQWFLFLRDFAGGDIGTVYNWSVHLLNQGPISVKPSTWTTVKALYR